jgi:hypothetical protein
VIRVLVVEDDAVAADAHRAYVDRTPGFTTVAVAGTGAVAQETLARVPVDLVLLDMNLPDTHGIDLCRRIRGAGADIDILAVTSARGYLLKPFQLRRVAGPVGRLRELPPGASGRGPCGRSGGRRRCTGHRAAHSAGPATPTALRRSLRAGIGGRGDDAPDGRRAVRGRPPRSAHPAVACQP